MTVWQRPARPKAGLDNKSFLDDLEVEDDLFGSMSRPPRYSNVVKDRHLNEVKDETSATLAKLRRSRISSQKAGWYRPIL
jgi:hypothetical protein